MFAGKKSAQIREILISESAWEEMTCLFAPSLDKKSNTRSILNFFLKKETAGNYHTKFQLSLREKQILSMLSRGESNQEIAEEFGVKLKTIYTHRRNLMNKLGCKNRITFQNLFFNNKCLFK